MAAYYNEFDPFAAAWLRNLIAKGLIVGGDVDERDIRQVQAADLVGYAQVHLFAGIGGWSVALRMAGWGDERAVWTGSCPCQPFTLAGQRRGFDDSRHLWPEMRRLIIAAGRPEPVLGEQAATAIGFGWLDLVSSDLEAEGYTVGAVVLGAHSVGARHIRNRLYWAADSNRTRWANDKGRGSVAESVGIGPAVRSRSETGWRDRWKAEPGIRRIVDGLRNGPHPVRAIANAIVPQTAAAFIGAYMECRP